MEILRTQNLTKIYRNGENKVTAVNNISISVNKGDFIAIMGSSGSGKSTLLHLLGGVDKPTFGKVIINGIDLYSLSEDELAIFRRREIGLIYQFFNLIPILNVKENIILPCELDKKNISETEIEKLLNILGLENKKNNLPHQLSGGQQQRVAIGRSLITKPSIILADEPTGNLDSKSSSEIISLLKNANKQFHQTIIMITHDFEIAKSANKIVRIEDGKIVYEENNNENIKKNCN